jgi:hypothetical protein
MLVSMLAILCASSESLAHAVRVFAVSIVLLLHIMHAAHKLKLKNSSLYGHDAESRQTQA